MAATIHPGVLKAFDSGTYKARVQLTGSIHMSLSGVPTNRGIASGDMIVGRRVSVVLFDETKADDAVVTAVYTP
jgi:hypothetical protein